MTKRQLLSSDGLKFMKISSVIIQEVCAIVQFFEAVYLLFFIFKKLYTIRIISYKSYLQLVYITISQILC